MGFCLEIEPQLYFYVRSCIAFNFVKTATKAALIDQTRSRKTGFDINIFRKLITGVDVKTGATIVIR